MQMGDCQCSLVDRAERMNLLLGFLLLCADLDPSWLLYVIQSPDVSVLEGEAAEISCCWTRTPERVGLRWLKNQTLIKQKTFINRSEGSQNEQTNKCVALIIEKIKMIDSGRYVCRVSVEIPVLSEVNGNGTTITVTAREKPPEGTDQHISEEEKETIDEAVEDKQDDTSNPHTVDETPLVHLEDKDKDDTVRPKEKTADILIKHIDNDHAETASKGGEKTEDNRRHTADDGSQEEVFTFVLRCLPILVLITAFFWLHYLGTQAQKERAASGAVGNEASSQQNTEEDQEKEEEDVAEEAREQNKDMDQKLGV